MHTLYFYFKLYQYFKQVEKTFKISITEFYVVSSFYCTFNIQHECDNVHHRSPSFLWIWHFYLAIHLISAGRAEPRPIYIYMYYCVSLIFLTTSSWHIRCGTILSGRPFAIPSAFAQRELIKLVLVNFTEWNLVEFYHRR